MLVFFEKLRPFIRWVARHPLPVLGIATLLTVLGMLSAVNLRIDPDFANLLPSDYASVQALEKLRATVGGESEAAVIIQSPSFEANRAFAEAFIPQALALRPAADAEPFFRRVDYRRETAFLQRNALYFATDDELDELETYLEDLREEARLEVNPFYFDLEEDFEDEEAPAAADEEPGARLEEAYDRIVGKEYPVSADSTVMVLRLYPSGSQTNIRDIQLAFDSLGALIARMEPAQHHAQMEVTTAGRLYRQLVEVRSIQRDVTDSFGAGILIVLLSVVVYFVYKAYHARSGGHFDARLLLATLVRAPMLMLLIGLPLLMSLAWTSGLAYLIYGTLNLMTSALGLVLFGLGIDYGIHFYARYTEERARGFNVVDAMDRTFASTAQAITIGALSTAGALYTIVFADFKGFSEFGFIAGTGVLLALVAMIVVLPAFVSLFERWHLLKLEGGEAYEPHTGLRNRPIPAARPIVIVSLLAVVAAFAMLPRLGFEYNFSKLEPTYEEYNARNAPTGLVYGGNRRNPAYVVTDTPEEIPAIVAAYEARAADSTSLISDVESLQQRFPLTAAEQQRKLARIAHIRELLADEFLTAEPNADLDRLRLAASTSAPLTLDDVPESIRKQYTTKSGELGNFVIVYPDPDSSLSDGRRSIRFAEQVGEVTTADGRTYHAGSTSLVAADMLRLMREEAPYAVGATLVMVVFLMWLNFRTLKWTLLGLMPLFVGILWMLLGMEIFDLQLNFYNLVVLPSVLGMGEDGGVHLVHRYREEGPGSLRFILRSTGEQVFMSSLTTMIGFGGLLLSFHPGMRSIGQLAVLGMGGTLLASLVFLPAVLQWMEYRHQARAVAAK